MSNNLKNVILIGCGPMALAYFKVLKSIGAEVIVIGRGEDSAIQFERETNQKVIRHGLANKSLTYLDKSKYKVIIAVSVEMLAGVTIEVLNIGFNDILVEKPGGLNLRELKAVAEVAGKVNAAVLVAYNRRFFASTIMARKIIEKDGGLLSFNFEFTEWADDIQSLKKAPGVKENWFLANSTHVVDLAFYLGGVPDEMYCFSKGGLPWHKPSIFAGAGMTDTGIVFSYQANWESAGRWGIEMMTAYRKLIFRPMERLKEQKKNTILIADVPLDDALDKEYKPGLYLETSSFLDGKYDYFIDIHHQYEMTDLVYNRICKQ